MVSSGAESAKNSPIDNEYFNEELSKVVASLLPKYDKMVRRYALIDLFFTLLLAAEISLLLFCFQMLFTASAFAFALALLFFTFFGYLMYRSYSQTHKPEQQLDFKARFLRGCKQLINYREGAAEHHLALAHACCRLAVALQGRETLYFQPPGLLAKLFPLVEKGSRWYFWRDLYTMRELLLECSVEQHIQLVKCEPTKLDAHAALANAYVMLSGLYDAMAAGGEELLGSRYSSFLEEVEEKFRFTSKRAIEEFKILNEYAPNDPWVHAQLAYSYRDLKMPLEEIKVYELLLRLRPNDQQTLFNLGKLYFGQGMNAKGLRIYERLKQANFKQAEELIAYYGG